MESKILTRTNEANSRTSAVSSASQSTSINCSSSSSSESDTPVLRYYFIRASKKVNLDDFKRGVESAALQSRRLESLMEHAETESYNPAEVDLTDFEIREMSKEKISAKKRTLLKRTDCGIHCIIKGTRRDFSALEGYLTEKGLDVDAVRGCENKSLDYFKSEKDEGLSLGSFSTIAVSTGAAAIAAILLCATAGTSRPSFRTTPSAIEMKVSKETPKAEITGAVYSFSTAEDYEEKTVSVMSSLKNYLDTTYPSLKYSVNSPKRTSFMEENRASLQGIISGNASEIQEVKKFIETGLSLKLDKSVVNYIYKKAEANSQELK